MVSIYPGKLQTTSQRVEKTNEMQTESVKWTARMCIKTYCFSDYAYCCLYGDPAINSLHQLRITLVCRRNTCLKI